MATSTLRTLGINLALNHVSFRRDVDKVDKRMKRMAANTRRVARTMSNNFAGLGATFASIAAGRFVRDQADAMVNLRNKMSAVFDTQYEVSQGMLDIKRIARESRAELDSVGTLYQRLAVSMKGIGATQDQVATATQVVTNTFLLSGTTAQEAANSARQFAQGLASGSLKGDEFRSVSENNVVLLQLLSEGLGMNVGQLKAFAAAGGLTAETILPILERALEKTNKQVSEMEFTIGQATTLIKNRFTEIIDQLNQRFKIIPKVANGFKMLGENIGTVALVVAVLVAPPMLGALTSGLLALAAAAAKPIVFLVSLAAHLALVTVRIVALAGSFLLMPTTWIVLAILGIVAAVYELEKRFGFMKPLMEFMNQAWDKFVGWLKDAGNWLERVKNGIIALVREIPGMTNFIGPGVGGAFVGPNGKTQTIDPAGLPPPSLFSDTYEKLKAMVGDMGGGSGLLTKFQEQVTGMMQGISQAAFDAVPGLKDFFDILTGNAEDSDRATVMNLQPAFEQWLINQASQVDTWKEVWKSALGEVAMMQDKATTAMMANYETVGDVMQGLGESMAAFAALNRAIALQRIIMNAKVAISEAWATPFPGNLAAVALVTARTALLIKDAMSNKFSFAGAGSNVSAITKKKGQAHDGLNNVPSTGTYLLERGERVLGSRLNADLTEYLAQGAGSKGDVHLHVNGVSDPDVVVNALSKRRGELESMLRRIAADDARNYRGA